MSKADKKKQKTAKEVAKEIGYILQENNMAGTVYVEGIGEHFYVDVALSPYHAGVLHTRSTANMQKDYKSMGAEIYAQFRKGMLDATREFGATRLVAEKD